MQMASPCRSWHALWRGHHGRDRARRRRHFMVDAVQPPPFRSVPRRYPTTPWPSGRPARQLTLSSTPPPARRRAAGTGPPWVPLASAMTPPVLIRGRGFLVVQHAPLLHRRRHGRRLAAAAGQLTPPPHRATRDDHPLRRL